MRPPKNSWPQTDESRGILMFAQLMAEMLSPISFESFRVYSLDSIARLRETLIVIRDVKLDRLPRQALTPIIDEVIWSLEKDPVIKRMAAHEIGVLNKNSKSNANLEMLAANIKLINRLISKTYKSALEQRIVELFVKSKERIEFRQTCGFYCSHLINVGYSRSYILELVQQHFFASNITLDTPELLTTFFEKFDCKKKGFNVFTVVSEQFGNYRRKLGLNVFHFDEVPEVVSQALNKPMNVHLSLVVTRTVEELDPYRAIINTHNFLNSTRGLTYLAPEGMPCQWSNEMFVIEGLSENGRLVSRPDIWPAPGSVDTGLN